MEWLWISLAVLGSLCALLLLAYPLLLIRPRRMRSDDAPLLADYAHRGLFGGEIPENSLAAFAAACHAGVGIELDVQLSADGEVMVFHDASLSRMTGVERRLCELDAASLGRLSLNGTAECIPTLDEVLTLVDGRVPLLVELKGENFDTSLCPRVAARLREYRGDYCIESFNPLLLRAMQRELPDACCGLLYTNVCRDKKRATPLNLALTLMLFNFLSKPRFIAYNQRDRSSFPLWLATHLYRRAGRFVWTVKPQDTRVAGECCIFENH